MRPTVLSAVPLRQFLRRNRIATLPQLKQLMGTDADITVFRKLKELSYRASYSHRGSFYTLAEIADFDERGLWSFGRVCFSRHGTLLATVEIFVTQAPAGYFAFELENILHVPVKEPLLRLAEQDRIARQTVSGLYLYCASNSHTRLRWLGTSHHRLSLSFRGLQMEPHRASLVQPDQPELGSRAAGQLRESPEVYPHHHNHYRLESNCASRYHLHYPTGVKVSKQELAQLSIRQKRVLPKWNYTISPQM